MTVSTYDLHTHSTASDGVYTPTELVQRAAAAGVGVLALSDHDSTAGLAEAASAAVLAGVRLIPAAEISTTWQDHTIHVLGLNLDVSCEVLQAGLRGLQLIRGERALEMGRRLAREGIPGVFEGARERAGTGMITRTHFARHLYEAGVVASIQGAFDRYLTRGRPGYVSTRWVDLGVAIGWIREAGGVAVLAHPQRYALTGRWRRRLLEEFKEAGGLGLEVVSGTGGAGDVQCSAEYARRFGLLASCGSDFHGPDHAWPKLGRLPTLPAGLMPVWRLWDDEWDSEKAGM